MMLSLTEKDGRERCMMLSVIYFMTWPNKRNMRGENKAICMSIVYPWASKFHRSVQFPTQEDMSKATVPFQLGNGNYSGIRLLFQLRNTLKARKRLVYEPFVFDFRIVSEVHQVYLKIGPDDLVAFLLKYNLRSHFRVFRVFRSFLPHPS